AVGRAGVHAGARESRAPEDVTAAHHQRELDIHPTELLQPPRDGADDRGLAAVVPVGHQGLTRELHQDPRVAHGGLRHLNTSADGKNPALGGVPTKSSVWSFAAGFLLGSSSISWGARGVPRNRRVASSVHLRVLAL